MKYKIQLTGIQNLFIEEGDMVEATKLKSAGVSKKVSVIQQKQIIVNIRVSTFSATTLLVRRPLELFTGALLAKVTGKGLDL